MNEGGSADNVMAITYHTIIVAMSNEEEAKEQSGEANFGDIMS